jgi:imidazolonepropionase-like amidohydrolase
MSVYRIALFAAFILATPQCLADESNSHQLALKGATIIDGTGEASVPDGVVLVDAGKIACVGTQADCPIPPMAETIDLSGKWITPGLIDSHVHLSQTGWFDGRPDGLDARDVFPYEEVAKQLRDHPEKFFRSYLCSGVTSVYDVGGHQWTLALGALTENDHDAPHVRASGALVTHAPHEKLNAAEFVTFLPMNTVAEARASVAKLSDWGSTAIKVWYLKPPDDRTEQLDQIFRTVASEAHARNLDLIVHATTLREAKLAVAEGAQMLVHGVLDEPVDDEFLRIVVENDVIYVPTLVVTSNWMRALASVALDNPYSATDPNGCVDPETARKIKDTSILQPYRTEYLTEEQGRKFLEQVAEFDNFLKGELLRVYEAGITIATGTDAGNPLTLHGVSILDEMLIMQDAGIPPAEILVMSTRNGARAMGRLQEIGTIASGKIADLLVLRADPTVDITNFQKLELVMRAGKLHSISELSYDRSCAESNEPRDVIQAQVEAYNNHDLEAFIACYAGDAEIHYLEDQQPGVRGHSALRERYTFLKSVPDQFGVQIVERIVSDSVVIDKERIVGLPDGGTMPDAIAVYEVLNGKIQNVWFPPIGQN